MELIGKSPLGGGGADCLITRRGRSLNHLSLQGCLLLADVFPLVCTLCQEKLDCHHYVFEGNAVRSIMFCIGSDDDSVNEQCDIFTVCGYEDESGNEQVYLPCAQCWRFG